ncbi:MAG: hypothetical protein Q8K60_07045, partial [Parachlamydiaceae bacterium]|nr:hypothetical protein [Parachlamydiaceae bacterium]
MEFKQQSSSWLTIFFIVCLAHFGVFSLGFNFSRPIPRPNQRPQVFVQTIQLNPASSKNSLMPIALVEENSPQKNQAVVPEIKVEEKPKEVSKPISPPKKKIPKPLPSPKTQQEKKPEVKKQETKPKPPIKNEVTKQKEITVENQKKEA